MAKRSATAFCRTRVALSRAYGPPCSVVPACRRSFFKYVAVNEPQFLHRCQRLLAMPVKRHGKRAIDYLPRAETCRQGIPSARCCGSCAVNKNGAYAAGCRAGGDNSDGSSTRSCFARDFKNVDLVRGSRLLVAPRSPGTRRSTSRGTRCRLAMADVGSCA